MLRNTIIVLFASCIALTIAGECGIRKIVSSKQSETSVGKNEFPWHLGLYENGRLQCGATLLSPTVSITAAHCFLFSKDYSNYTLVAGKHYKKFKDSRDADTQHTKIAKLIVHPDYNDGEPIQNFDLALLIHEQPFILTNNVMPACFDATITTNADLIDKKGIIVGWGNKMPKTTSTATTTGNESGDFLSTGDVLEMLEVDYKPIRRDCKLPFNFKIYYAADKLCAGLYNKGRGVCRGDGGGGLMHLANDGHYYIRGIASLTPLAKGGCDYNSNSLYTSVAYFANYIANVTALH